MSGHNPTGVSDSIGNAILVPRRVQAAREEITAQTLLAADCAREDVAIARDRATADDHLGDVLAPQ